MADIFGLVAGVLQLIDTLSKARDYIQDFRNAPKHHQELLNEIMYLRSLLKNVESRISFAGQCNRLKELKEPLTRLNAIMERLAKSLTPDGIVKLSSRLAWPLWGKKDVDEALGTIERLKTLLNAWLAMDILDSAQDITSVVSDIAAEQHLDHQYIIKTLKYSAHQNEQAHGHMISALTEATEEHRINHSDFSASVRNIAQKQEWYHESAERDRIIEWYSPLNFFLRQADIFNSRQPGTGEWLLDHASFRQWKSGINRKIWCCGMPGAGKTVLVSIVVDNLRTELASHSIGVAVIYLNHKEVDAHSPSKLLASLWRQLVFRQPIGSAVHKLYKEHHEPRTRPSLHEDHTVLRLILADYSKVFILVDALDEYPEAQRDILLGLLSTLGPNLNILVTSRPNITINHITLFERLNIQAKEVDIRKYIEGQIVKSPRLLKHIRNSSDLREAIEANIVQRSDGMFLLAKLHIDSLGTKLTIKAVREALNSLPRELSSTFDEVVHRINGQSEEEKTLAWLVLSWVTNARRPLELSELMVALAVEPGSSKLNTENLPDAEDILSVCAGLVIIREDNRVHIIHYTLQHYLEQIQNRVFPRSQSEITMSCITYLLFAIFPRHDIGHALAKHLFSTNPLLDYAVNYVLIHAHGEPKYDIKDTILSFLDQCSGWVEFWNWSHRLERIPTAGTSVWIAAFFDLQEITRCLMPHNGVEADVTATSILPPLPLNSVVYVAIIRGHTDEARILVGDRTYVEALGEYYGTALQFAVSKEQKETLHLLLDGSDNDIDAKGGPQGGALLTALSRGNLAMAKMLIEHHINIRWSGTLRSKLLASCDKIISLLIKYGIYIEACGWRSGGLMAASLVGDEETARLLIESGADVNGTDIQVDAHLESVVASSSGHFKLPAVPVNSVNSSTEQTNNSQPGEVDLNTLDVGNLPVLLPSLAEGGLTMDILEGAMWERFGSCDGFLRIVLCATSTGSLYSVKFKEGGYATEILKRLSGDTLNGLIKGDGIQLSYGRKNLLIGTKEAEGLAWQRLVQGTVANTDTDLKSSGVVETTSEPSGANKEHKILATGGPYGSALIAASSTGHHAIIQLLIEYGTDINFMPSPGKNALEAASSAGYEHIVQLLIEHGANINSADVLAAASRNGHEQVVRLLIKYGVNINSTNALQAASSTGDEHIVRLLLEHGADINSTHALDAASSRGNEQIVRLLIECGADVTESALEEAAGEGHEQILRLLIARGVEVDASNALKEASGRGHKQIVEFLIDYGANVNSTGALAAASRNGHEQIVKLLLEHGAVDSTVKAASSRGDKPIVRRPLPLRNQARDNEIVNHVLERGMAHTAFHGFGSSDGSGIITRRRRKIIDAVSLGLGAAPSTGTAVARDGHHGRPGGDSLL